MVRAKFYVAQKLPQGGGGQVTLRPVTEGSVENESFFKYTPGGEIGLATVNQSAFDEFREGAEYYVDFSKAE